MLCYANADIVRGEKNFMPLHFVEYWKDLTGVKPDWLYMDSKMTSYAVLDQLCQDGNIRADSDWNPAQSADCRQGGGESDTR